MASKLSSPKLGVSRIFSNSCASSSVLNARLRGRSVPPASRRGEKSAAGLLRRNRRRTPNAKIRRVKRSRSLAAVGARPFAHGLPRDTSARTAS
jgi:hypothetical protein